MNRALLDAIEDLALTISNLWDDESLVNRLKDVYCALYGDGRPSVCAFQTRVDEIRETIERVRDWADMASSALDTCEDIA